MGNHKRRRSNRRSSHPGEILRDVWLTELSMTQSEFAQKISDTTGGQIKNQPCKRS